MLADKPRLMFLTSKSAGLAHYVVHLWDKINYDFDPIYVTYSSAKADDLLASHVQPLYSIIDPEDFTSIGRVLSLIDELNIGYVNLHSGTKTKTFYAYYSTLLKELRKKYIKIIIHMHDAAVHDANDKTREIIKEFGRSADSILVGSHKEMEFVKRLVQNPSIKIKLMRHGPYTLLKKRNLTKRQARDELGIAAHVPVILSFGAVREEKRLQDIIGAFSIVKQRVPDAILLMQSDPGDDGVEINQLESYGKLSGVRMSIGYVHSRQVELLFQAADVVALAYERTAASGVLNLARAFQCPVVVSDSFEQASSIDNVCGYVTPSKNPEKLAKALVRIISLSENQRCSMSRNWHSALMEETWENAAAALVEVCLDTIHDPSPHAF